MCSCILKLDAFKWANSYTGNSLAGTVVLMESLAQSKGWFSSCGDVADRSQVTTNDMWGKSLRNKSQCLLAYYKLQATLPDCWGVHPEWQGHNWDRILSLNSRNRMATSLTRKGDRKFIGTLFPYYYTYQFNKKKNSFFAFPTCSPPNITFH